jgi:hypothetical protein
MESIPGEKSSGGRLMEQSINWLPTAISGLMLALLLWLIKRSSDQMEQKIKAVAKKLSEDEDQYMTKVEHQLVCGKNNSDVKLHINDVVRKQREDMDSKFERVYAIMDEIKNMIKNGGKK